MNKRTVLGLAVVGLSFVMAAATFARDTTTMGGNMMGQTTQQTHHGVSHDQNINKHHRFNGNTTHHADASKYLKNAPCHNADTKGGTKVR